MTNRKPVTKLTLVSAVVALMLCFAMLLGTTYAWFTDSVTSAGNIIKTGKLEVEMQWADGTQNPNNVTWNNAEDGEIFKYDRWEPGYVQVRHIRIANVGNLALHYQIRIETEGDLAQVDPAGHTLADAIDVYYADPAMQISDRQTLNSITPVPLSEYLGSMNLTTTNTMQGDLYPHDYVPANGGKECDVVTIALKMRETAGNEYQNKELGASFSVKLLATQLSYESDSFGPDYDGSANGEPDSSDLWTTYTTSATVTDPAQDTVITAGPVALTVPANSSDANDNYQLIVEPSNDAGNLVIEAENHDTTTYDVTLIKNDTEVVDNNGDIIYTVALNIGIVDLQKFYHKNIELTRVENIANLAEGKYYYAGDTVTFMTKSFSPFTAEYLFAGGLGTANTPYLVETYSQLVNIDKGIPETDGATFYYKLIGNIDASAHDSEIANDDGWAHGFLYNDTRNYVIDLNSQTITIGDYPIFGYASQLEVYNGTINYTGYGSPFVDYGCYQSVGVYNFNFHDLTLTGSATDNGDSHYGPLVAYGFLLNSGSAVFTARNIVNNMTIKSSNSDGYAGGLFGYIQGTAVSVVVENCVFNGSITAPHAGGFINTCSAPKAGVTSENNVLNGSLFGTADARPFGCNGNVTGGSSALTALNNTVALGANAAITVISPSANLFTVNDDFEVIIHNSGDVDHYRAAVLFMVNSNANGTGGYPRYITVDIADPDEGDITTGLYKYAIVDESTDGSAGHTIVTSYDDGTVIWIENGAYHFYSANYSLSNNRATIYVYGYDASGNIVTYQTQGYTY